MTPLRPRPAAAGFTIVELMVVLIIIGVLATVVVFSARRPAGDVQIDAAASNFRFAVANARQRAIATHTAHFVEISQANGFRYCTARTDLVPPTGDHRSRARFASTAATPSLG